MGAVLIAVFVVVYACLVQRSKRRFSKLAELYEGTISSLGDSVSFSREGVRWGIKQLASGGGMAGTGSYSVLEAPIVATSKTWVMLQEARKYFFVGGFPREHAILRFAAKEVVVVGVNHRVLSAKLADPVLADVLVRLLQVEHSAITVFREWRVEGWQWPRSVWCMRLNALPRDLLRTPSLLEPVLNDMMIVRAALSGH